MVTALSVTIDSPLTETEMWFWKNSPDRNADLHASVSAHDGWRSGLQVNALPPWTLESRTTCQQLPPQSPQLWNPTRTSDSR